MRTTRAHLHVPHHPSRWWLSHSVAAIAMVVLLVYAAGVLLVMAGRLLVS